MKIRMESHIRIRKLVNIILAITVAISWVSIFFSASGTLMHNGINSLKYFTVLSNLLEGAASVIWLVSTRKNEKASAHSELLKYIAAAAVGLTCVTVLVFLGPLYGYPAMFAGGSLYMHLLTPVVAIAEIIFLSDFTYTRKDNRLAVLSPLIYGVFYLGNNIINGIGEWPDTNDWYFFLAWGYPVGILIFVIICIVTWLLGLVMRKMQRTRT
ncbi:MAG: hypothetical protein IJJ03_01685 [Mogibacterium sp.]|nr:hypothetical protein [Mogibacterium sp.]MBQ6500520.1 hypothetical protein [Mogibacterium sp.]